MPFDNNDVSRKDAIKSQDHEVVDCNIEIDANLKIVKISKALLDE
jgi:hypothetical protein